MSEEKRKQTQRVNREKDRKRLIETLQKVSETNCERAREKQKEQERKKERNTERENERERAREGERDAERYTARRYSALTDERRGRAC